MPSTGRRTRLGTTLSILLWVAALGVLAENVALLRQNRRLRDAAAPQIAAGTQLQMISGLTLDGRIEPVGLPPAGSKLLVFTFSPGCPACQANQANWMSLASTLGQKGGVRVLWVSRDPIEITKEYCLKRGIALSGVLADPPYRAYLQLGLARVPNTLLVDASGVVEKVWAGRLDQAGWDTMFAYFGERQEKAYPAQSMAGAITTGCGNDSSGAPAKNCKQEAGPEKRRREKMLKQVPKVVLLVALLTTLAVNSVSAFANDGCLCVFVPKPSNHGCILDKKLSQCINTTCPGVCLTPVARDSVFNRMRP